MSKGCYLLSRIDKLVDATTGHELLMFTDMFLGYNQICLILEGEEKIAFITDHGLFCSRVMPFNLKNVGENLSVTGEQSFKRPN